VPAGRPPGMLRGRAGHEFERHLGGAAFERFCEGDLC
jgi:hypothetical protein